MFTCGGTVFKITLNGTLTTLYSFGTTPDGFGPYGALVHAADGDFYGTTGYGGANNSNACLEIHGCGTIFKITPSGALTTLHSFDFTDGAHPSGLVQGTDGHFYGTTAGGGTNTYRAAMRVAVRSLTSLQAARSRRFIISASQGGSNCTDGTGPLRTGPGHQWRVLRSNVLWRRGQL